MILLVLLSPGWASALPSSSLLDLDALSSTDKKGTASSAEIFFEQSQFLSDPTNTSTKSSRGSFGINLGHESGENLRKRAVLNAEFALTENRTAYIAVPELFVSGRPSEGSPFFFNFGRKKRDWSRMDEQWSLGLWQPLARWDYFKPESQGLVGLGFGAGHSRAGVEFFASSLSIPDQGPQFSIVDGQFESDNRWFWRPQTEIGIFEEQIDIRYKLFRPSEEKVFNHPSFAARVWAGEYLKTPWMSAAYSYKPINQFHLALNPAYMLSQGNVEVAIYPEVVHHHLATFEAGLGDKVLNAWVSVSQEWPEKPEYPDFYLQSALQESFWASASVGHEIGFRDFSVVWSYMRRWVLNDEQKENLVGMSVESSYGRFPIEEAASLSWSGTILRGKGYKLGWRNQYWYSIAEEGGWLSTSLDLQQSNNILWRLEFDVLGTSAADDDTRGLVSRYRSNDRILGGFHYVF